MGEGAKAMKSFLPRWRTMFYLCLMHYMFPYANVKNIRNPISGVRELIKNAVAIN